MPFISRRRLGGKRERRMKEAQLTPSSNVGSGAARSMQPGESGAYRTPLQRERRIRGWSQQQVVDRVIALYARQTSRELSLEPGMLSRWERGVIRLPRSPYPSLLASLYELPVPELFPKLDRSVSRRRFNRLDDSPVENARQGAGDADITRAPEQLEGWPFLVLDAGAFLARCCRCNWKSRRQPALEAALAVFKGHSCEERTE
jgi:transcriptional regulator with XRE-family HTH domain